MRQRWRDWNRHREAIHRTWPPRYRRKSNLGVIADLTPLRLQALRIVASGSLECDVKSFNWLKRENLIALRRDVWNVTDSGRFLLKRLDSLL